MALTDERYTTRALAGLTDRRPPVRSCGHLQRALTPGLTTEGKT